MSTYGENEARLPMLYKDGCIPAHNPPMQNDIGGTSIVENSGDIDVTRRRNSE